MKSPLHPSDEEALQTIDAMMHGDVTSTNEKFKYISQAVESWTRVLQTAKTRPMRRALDAADDINQHLCALEKDDKWNEELLELRKEYNAARAVMLSGI